MIKIWFKLITDDKIVKNTVFSLNDVFSIDNFTYAINTVCNDLDIPSPVILSKHLFQYINFNTTTFTTGDFVEPLNYDKLILENALEDN